MSRARWTCLGLIAAGLFAWWALLPPGNEVPLVAAVVSRATGAEAPRADVVEHLGDHDHEDEVARGAVSPMPAGEPIAEASAAPESPVPSEVRRTLILTLGSYAPSRESTWDPPSPSSRVCVRASSSALHRSGTEALLRTYRSRWEQPDGAGAHLQVAVELVLHRPGLVHLATTEPIWNQAVRIDHSSPDPIRLHIEAPVERYLVLRGNEGRLGPEEVNVSFRQVDPAGAGIGRKGPWYDTSRERWAILSSVADLEVEASLKLVTFLNLEWVQVEWPGASRTVTIDLSYVAVLRLTVFDAEGNAESIQPYDGSVDAIGPAGPVLLKGQRRYREFRFGVPEFGDYRVIVTDKEGRTVTEQWFEVAGPGEHEFDLVIDD